MQPAVTPTLSDAQLLDWLRLLRTDGVGPKTFQSLINQFGSAAQALRELPDLSLRKTGRRINPIPLETAERELSTARRMGARFVARGQSGYPKALAMLDSAPPLLAVLGPLNLDAKPMVAIVGSRNASLPGLRMAEKLATGIGGHGYTIVSGLARGIDAGAHAAALATGTVAVLAGGLDRMYPEENRGLFDRIAAEGAVVSEMPFGWEPRGRDFPRRNRIVSGLCLGTIVVEANRKSGSLITARFALDQGRNVYAVPGSPLDPRAEGPNSLIRQGAMLVTSAEDILDDLRDQREPLPRQMSMLDQATATEAPLWDEADWLGHDLAASVGPEEPPPEGWHEADPADLKERILELLTAAPADPDDLARATGVSARDIRITLFDLETDGMISRRLGGVVSMVVR